MNRVIPQGDTAAHIVAELSHASLLVEMGFSPLLIAERLGHEKVQTTMDTYSHLYPNKQVELNGIMP